MSISSDNLRALSAFAVVAKEYCDVISSLRAGRPDELYRKLEKILSHLHSAILPVEMEMPSREHPEFEKLSMTSDQHAEISRLIGKATEEERRALFEEHGAMKPETDDEEKYKAGRAEMLWDDLADIYRELHDGLALWRIGISDSQAEAAWQWRFGFEAHWGYHLVNAIATIHEARYRLLAK